MYLLVQIVIDFLSFGVWTLSIFVSVSDLSLSLFPWKYFLQFSLFFIFSKMHTKKVVGTLMFWSGCIYLKENTILPTWNSSAMLMWAGGRPVPPPHAMMEIVHFSLALYLSCWFPLIMPTFWSVLPVFYPTGFWISWFYGRMYFHCTNFWNKS